MLLSLFWLPVFVLGFGCFPELRLFRAAVDLLLVWPARFAARVFVQVVEHLAEDRLEGAERRADRRRAEAVGDQAAGRRRRNINQPIPDKSEESLGFFRTLAVKLLPLLSKLQRKLLLLQGFNVHWMSKLGFSSSAGHGEDFFHCNSSRYS